MAEQTTSTGTYQSPYKFNGKELDAETGLYNYGARYYDAKASVWLSVDPMGEKHPDMSVYSFCANNPVILIDPDGRDWFKDSEGNIQFFPKATGNFSEVTTKKSWEHIGETYKTSSAQYRKDGSIIFSNTQKALNYIHNESKRTGKEELALLLKGGGALVTPDYKNTISKCTPFGDEKYGYTFDGNGNVSDKEGSTFSLIGSIHPHPYIIGEPKSWQFDPFPSGTYESAEGDLETFSMVTPNMPAMTMGWDNKVYGVYGNYKHGNPQWNWLSKNGYYTVQDILTNGSKFQSLMKSTVKFK